MFNDNLKYLSDKAIKSKHKIIKTYTQASFKHDSNKKNQSFKNQKLKNLKKNKKSHDIKNELLNENPINFQGIWKSRK